MTVQLESKKEKKKKSWPIISKWYVAWVSCARVITHTNEAAI